MRKNRELSGAERQAIADRRRRLFGGRFGAFRFADVARWTLCEHGAKGNGENMRRRKPEKEGE